jgi:hypothetical protein
MVNIARRSSSVESSTSVTNGVEQPAIRPKAWRHAVDAGMTFASWRALGDWVGTLLSWSYDGTLTFKYPVSASRAIDHAKEWLRGLAKMIDGHIVVLFGVERHDLGGHHVHLLLRPEPRIGIVDAGVLARSWLASTPVAGPRSEFRLFRVSCGGEHYVVKDGDWDFFVACPRWRACRRSDRCHREKVFTRTIAQR